jgi:predicted nucleic acid-binding protein
VAVVLDTGILFAAYDRDDAWHRRAVALLEAEYGGLVVPAPIVTEVDHLLRRFLGERAQERFYSGFAEGDYYVAQLPPPVYLRALEFKRQYEELRLGHMDAAVLAVAESLNLGRIATTDRRHFGAVRISVPLEILP